MNDSGGELERDLREEGFLPFQVEFIKGFVQDDSPRTHVLRATPGSGVSRTVAAVVEVLRRSGEAKNVLILAPLAIAHQMVFVLKERAVVSQLVDRYRYRELEANTTSGHLPWERGGAFVLGIDFAKQEDVRSGLLATRWDLVVVMNSSRFSGGRSELVNSFVSHNRNYRLLLTETLMSAENASLQISDAALTMWTFADLRSWDGEPLFSPLRPTVRTIFYSLTAEERQLRVRVSSMADLMLLKGSAGSSFRSALIQKAALSSPAVLESHVRHLRNSLVRGVNEPVFEDEAVEESVDTHSEEIADVLPRVVEILQSLEELGHDTKLEVLVEELRGRSQFAPKNTQVCIFTRYLSNVAYIEAALSELALPIFGYHGSLSFETRDMTLREFKQTGGVLIGTPLLSDGVELPEVDLLVLYDVLDNRNSLLQIYGRFDRFARTKPLEIWVLQAEEDAQTGGLKVVQLLDEMLREQAGLGVQSVESTE